MTLGDEVALKLRRRDVDAMCQHALEVAGEAFLVAASRIGEVTDGVGVEEQGEHGTAMIQLDILVANNLLQFCDKLTASCFELVVES